MTTGHHFHAWPQKEWSQDKGENTTRHYRCTQTNCKKPKVEF